MAITLLNQSETTTTEVVFEFSRENSAFVYKEWRNDRGKVIDCLLVDNGGNEVIDPVILEEVQAYVDENDL